MTVKSRAVFLLVAVAAGLGFADPSVAQTAKLDVTVSPSGSNGQTTAAGFSVCVGTPANRALYGIATTPLDGVLRDAFENLQAGEAVVVTVAKSGFIGSERSLTLRAGRNNRVAVAPVSGVGGPSCSSVGPPPAIAPSAPPAPPPAAPTPVATSLQALTALTQTTPVGRPVQAPPAVIVRDQNGNAMQGVSVAFIVVTGGGSVLPASRVTGVDGTARVDSWTVGPTIGSNSIVAKATALQAVTFSATASDVTAPQVTAPGNVTVSATSASGAIVSYPAPTSSDNSGSVTVTCDPARGTLFPIGSTTVTCTARDPSGNTSSATFIVTVVAPSSAAQPPKPTTLQAISTLNQQAPAGSAVTSAPKVVLRDQNNDVMPNRAITFAVSSGGGSIGSTTVNTSDDGTATTTWTLGSNPGANSVTASVSNVEPVTFSATGVRVAKTVSATTPTDVSWSVSAAVPQPPEVIVKDQLGSPFAGATVTFAVTSGGGSVSPSSITTGSDGLAKLTSWTLGPNAGVNSVRATVQSLSPVDFKATAPFTIVAFVKRADGTAIANSQVCVGSRTRLDQFATVADAGTYGRQSFRVAAAPEYSITASKGGFVGQTQYVSGAGSSIASVLTLVPGTGGVACPGAVEISIPLSPEPLPDFDVNVKQSSNPISAGTQQRYTLRIHNRGGNVATPLTVRGTLPPDLTFVSSVGDHGFSCSRAGTIVDCSSGSIPKGDSATITVVMSLAINAASGHDILFSAAVDPDRTITEANEANNQMAAVASTLAVRLGEELLTIRGPLTTTYLGDRGITQLDCRQFGSSFVLVGIEGNGNGSNTNHLRAVCSPMRNDGTLSTDVSRTEFFLPWTSTDPSYDRKCPAGMAVTGAQASLSSRGTVVSIILSCRPIVATGLASGSVTKLAPTPGMGTTLAPTDNCTFNRPARALKIGLSSTEPFVDLMLVAERLICEQPTIP